MKNTIKKIEFLISKGYSKKKAKKVSLQNFRKIKKENKDWEKEYSVFCSNPDNFQYREELFDEILPIKKQEVFSNKTEYSNKIKQSNFNNSSTSKWKIISHITSKEACCGCCASITNDYKWLHILTPYYLKLERKNKAQDKFNHFLIPLCTTCESALNKNLPVTTKKHFLKALQTEVRKKLSSM